MHARDLIGRPDFVFDKHRLVVFVDGCYWHGCPECGRPPHSNLEYWTPKLDGNRRRDKAATSELKAAQWGVLRVWEHELEVPANVVKKITELLGRRAHSRQRRST